MIAAVFCSDALFIDGCGNYTTDFPEVCKQLGITSPVQEESFMKYKTVTGYMSAGRYKKPHIRAVKAGSTVCLIAEDAVRLPKFGYFGEKTGEGFGAVRFVRAEDIMSLGSAGFYTANASPNMDGALCALLDKNDKREAMRMAAINHAKGIRETLRRLTSSFIGRILLMIRQAEDYEDLLKRIGSVKNKENRAATEGVAHTAEQYVESGMWREYLETVFLLGKYFLRGTK